MDIPDTDPDPRAGSRTSASPSSGGSAGASTGTIAGSDAGAGAAAAAAPKLRRCLKCRAEFSSAWDGHRICDRCKHSSAWREGMSAQSYGTNGR